MTVRIGQRVHLVPEDDETGRVSAVGVVERIERHDTRTVAVVVVEDEDGRVHAHFVPLSRFEKRAA